jgi:Mn2+/Fe2+ NRAMP family transporter
MRADIFSGMVLAQSIFWFIMVTSAAALHNNNIMNISTAEQAAKALEPLVKGFPYAGQISEGMFAAGIIGNGLISVPVLAASASYAVSEAFKWKEGLYNKFLQAPKFYCVIITATIIGLWINFSGIDPIQALIYTAIINGFVAVPLLIVVTKIANNKEILGDEINNRTSNAISVVAIAIMAGAAILMIVYTWIIK